MKTKKLLPMMALLVNMPATADSLHTFTPRSTLPIDPRCNVAISHENIDFGTLTKGELMRDGKGYSPGKRTLMLSVTCPAPRVMRMVVQGDGAADGSLRYGSQGKLKLHLSNARLDGQAINLKEITLNDQPTRAELTLKSGTRFEVSDNGLPLRGKSFTARLEVEPELPDAATRVRTLTTSEARLSLRLIN